MSLSPVEESMTATAVAEVAEVPSQQSFAPAKPSLKKPRTTEKPRPSGSVFRAVWRWHFYAGIMITPILMLMSVTGGLYIFQSEIRDFVQRDFVFVAPQGERVSYKTQLEAAQAAQAEMTITRVQVHPDANRSTIITMKPKANPGTAEPATPEAFREAIRKQAEVYVNPYDGRVVGQVLGGSTVDGFFAQTLQLHRNLWAGTNGRILTELTTSWTIILLVTGIYLWWPRKNGSSAGVWTLRWKAKPYVVLRDLHSVFGFYLAPIALVITVTGLYYTFGTGTGFRTAVNHFTETKPNEGTAGQGRSRGEAGQQAQALASVAKREGSMSAPSDQLPVAKRTEPKPPIPIDTILSDVRARYPDRVLVANLEASRGRRGGGRPAGSRPASESQAKGARTEKREEEATKGEALAKSELSRGRGGPGSQSTSSPSNTVQVSASSSRSNSHGPLRFAEVTVNRTTGQVVSDVERVNTIGSWAYPLHTGIFWGAATKIPWLIACVVLTALPITGVLMWWKRRPEGTAGLPRKPRIAFPRWLVASLIGLCLMLPAVGASILLIVIGDTLGRWVSIYARRLRPVTASS